RPSPAGTVHRWDCEPRARAERTASNAAWAVSGGRSTSRARWGNGPGSASHLRSPSSGWRTSTAAISHPLRTQHLYCNPNFRVTSMSRGSGRGMGLREQKKLEQREAILTVALELFRAQGFDATRVQDVTERLRISEGTFFNYFPTKAAVLDAAAVDVLDRATVLLHHDVADHARAVLARLEELVRDFAANFAGDREFAAQLALHTRLGLGREREQQTHRFLSELFVEGQRRGEIRADGPARPLAELFIGVGLV